MPLMTSSLCRRYLQFCGEMKRHIYRYSKVSAISLLDIIAFSYFSLSVTRRLKKYTQKDLKKLLLNYLCCFKLFKMSHFYLLCSVNPGWGSLHSQIHRAPAYLSPACCVYKLYSFLGRNFAYYT